MSRFILAFTLVSGLVFAADFNLNCKGPGKSQCDHIQLSYKNKTWMKESLTPELEDSPNDYVMLMWDAKDGADTFHFTIAKGVITAPASKKFEATLKSGSCKSTLSCEKKP